MNGLSFPEIYERWLVGPLFRPWAEVILDELGVVAGDRVLDVACGTGIVARVAMERVGDAGQVVGVDSNPQMLMVARDVNGRIDWREGNAVSLPLNRGEEFDVVVCQQGLQFIPDKPAAVRQMRDALAPEGRVGVATWRPVEEIPLIRELHGVVEKRLGPIIDNRHRLGDASLLETLLREAGIQHLHVKTMSLRVSFEDGEIFVRLNAMALVGMSAAGKQLTVEERGRVADTLVSDSAVALSPYTTGRELSFEISTNIAIGRR
jgi:ubiquinone/menaquinone biosynthesis C-methylase UbiE